jgi:hypothetical protein
MTRVVLLHLHDSECEMVEAFARSKDMPVSDFLRGALGMPPIDAKRESFERRPHLTLIQSEQRPLAG